MFPIGHLMKSEVRAIAEAQKLPSAKRKDSQGICFLGKINYNDFIERYLGKRPGKIVELETGKVLGKHNGYWFHTIGQRKGLGLSGGPWFVIQKDIKRNIIYVSNGYDPETQYGKVINMQGFDFITEDPWENLRVRKKSLSRSVIPGIYAWLHPSYRRSISCRIRRKDSRYRSATAVYLRQRPSLMSGQRHDY